MTNIHLVYDCKASSIAMLVDLLDELYKLYVEKTANIMDKVMLLSVLGIITTNLSLFLRSMSQVKVMLIFEESVREKLKAIILSVIDKAPEDDASIEIAQSTLRLFITGIEVLFPLESERCNLLNKYLLEFSDGTLKDLERSVLELLLRKLSTSSSLCRIVAKVEGKNSSVDPDGLFESLLLITKRFG